MALEKIGTAQSWEEAFDTARQLLLDEQLTAVAIVSEEEYARGSYFATQLQEFEAVMGCVDAVVSNLEQMAPMLYGEEHSFRLMHGQFESNHPISTGHDWMLAIIYST